MGNPVSGPANTPVNQTPTNTPSRADADAPAKFGDALAKEQSSAGPQKPAQYDSPFIFLRLPSFEPPKQPVPIPRYTGTDVPKSPMATEKPADDYKQPTPTLEKKEPKGPPIKHSEGLGVDQGGHIISVEGKHDKLK
jgi:hypothetical protein